MTMNAFERAVYSLAPQKAELVDGQPDVIDTADIFIEQAFSAFTESDTNYSQLTRAKQEKAKRRGLAILQGMVDGVTLRQSELDAEPIGGDAERFRKATSEIMEYAVEVIGVRPTEFHVAAEQLTS